MEFLSKTAPLSTPPLASTPGEPGLEAATSRARSALAVLHDFDGFLRNQLRRFVAPCCRLWGSPGFEPTVDGHVALLGFRRSSAADCRGASEDALRPGVSRRGRSLGVTNRRSSDPPHRCMALRSFSLFHSGSPCLQVFGLLVVVRFAPKSSASLDLKAFSVEESVAPAADESVTGARCSLGLFLELQLSLCAPDCSGLLPATEVASAHRTASSAAPA